MSEFERWWYENDRGQIFVGALMTLCAAVGGGELHPYIGFAAWGGMFLYSLRPNKADNVEKQFAKGIWLGTAILFIGGPIVS